MSASGAAATPSDTATARGGLVNGAASIVGTGLAFAMTFVITNTWGAAQSGVFFAALAAFMIVATAMKLGAETALVLFIARLVADGRADQSRHTLKIALWPVAMASLLAASGLILAAEPLSTLFADGDRSDEFRDVIRVLALFVTPWALSLCLLGATRGAGTMAPTAYGLQLVQPTAQFVLVGVVALADGSITELAWAWAAPIAFTLVVASLACRRLLPSAHPIQAVTSSEFWSYATPRGIAGTLQMALDRVGVLIVGAVASAAIAGQWAAVSRLVGVAQRVFHAIGQALNPRISALAERQDWLGVRQTSDLITQWTMLVLGPALIGLACFPNAVLGLFGPEFAEAGTALRVTAIVVLGASLFAHADNVLLMVGDSRRAMVNTGAALVVAVILYLALSPSMEATGAAIAFAAGVVVYRGASTWQIRRHYDVTTVGTRSITAMLTTLVAALPPLLIGRIIGGDRFVAAAISGAAALAVFALVVEGLRRRGRVELALR